ncbi:retinoic acid-induced protein 1-like isoform X2 [Myxocyprinus asiaticus]|uniref:retinoic acid-induced protein 1-like isoform X2 n=1 Tax=Myxocyprinus asiaticus TaxID=70543 RepID=UPI002223723B|nr:retinoic acid-induced protein 1-like isoform X2 [Myxocyprinus asiaticus]
MQSFRERSGFHGNQHCYQQEPQELSRLESYRHHHSQSRQGYEAHSLAAVGMSTAGASPKDCYGQQTYPVYTSNSATQTKKPYRGAKTPNQHLQAGYSNHMGPGYSAQYMSEGHLQQKWDESAQMTQFEQDMVGRLESGVSGSSQYLEQNMLAISQSQCHLPSQSPAPAYTSPHQQGLPPNPAQSPLMYPQGHINFPQHSQPTSSTSSSSYMEKCNPMPHGYKGYGISSHAQYGRQHSNHSSLKQSGYRPQNNYGYQQTPSRSGFEQGSMQGMSGTQENLQKFQHYNQPQQNYCITDISVRSPEQYYQTCSPSSSHSPARSVGRSPSYNSTPSPLMANPDSFQYGQPPINPGASTSTSLQEPNMLMPPHTHTSPSVNHQSQSYSSSMKERFSEKLLSNPSLWSLNALTSQVENISNNVQQLLLSEALMAKKSGKRNHPKRGEDYRGQLKSMEDSSCPDNQHGPPPSDSYIIPRSMTAELQEGGYSSSTEDQMDRSYYYFGQDKGHAHTHTHSRLSLDAVSSCSVNSADDMSVRSGDSVRSLQSVASDDNINCDPRVQRVMTGEEPNSSLMCIRDERSPMCVTAPSPIKQESNSPPDIKRSESTLKENFEESAWTERIADEEEIEQRKNECKGEVIEKPQKWLEDEKSPSLFHKINKAVLEEGYLYETEVYQGLQNKYDSDKGDSTDMDCFSDLNHKGNEGTEIKSKNFKSEPQPNVESHGKISPGHSGTDLYLPEKEEKNSVESLISTEEPMDTLEEQQSVLSCNSTEVRDEKESLTTSEEVINNRETPQESFAEVCSTFEEMENVPQANTETAESFAQDTPYRGSERRSALCDIAPQPHTAMSGFSTLNEKITPLAQAREHHIDRSDAKVLEPDSPQLPGKSILHSAPSWADTPPSPKKGDEDMELGVSCPSAVTPSAKPEPLAQSAHTRMFGKKHARGRRRLMHSSIGIRRQLSVEGDKSPPSAQNPSLLSSKSMLIHDQMETAHKDISSQTQKLSADSLPSRMCTRSYVSQSSPKVCPQERRKPGPKPGPKPGLKLVVKPGPKSGPISALKPGPKPGLKPGPKPSPKSSAKPGPKLGPKSEAMPNVKPDPKPGSKNTGSTEGTKPGPKTGLRPGPKTGPKSGSNLGSDNLPNTTESKPTERPKSKGPGRPKGLTSKIKSRKQDKNVQITTDHTKDTSSINEFIQQDVTTDLTLDKVVGVVNTSMDETTLESAQDSTCVKSLVKGPKSMVLRSRKQTKEKVTEEKEQESDKSTETPSKKLTGTQLQDVTVDQSCGTKSSNLELPKEEDVSTDSLQQPNEEIFSIKRKSSLHSSDPPKRKRGVKASQTKTQGPPLETVMEVCIPKGKWKRGQHLLTESVSSNVITDNPPTDGISDLPSVPPQCPTKTKYLPPRKGRGLKYEAMVQKITSPGSKKQPLNIQPDIVPEELTSKLAPQEPEQREMMNAPEVAHEEGDSTMSTQEVETTAVIQTPRKKRRKWATVESCDAPEVALEVGSLINTPRLAKQRAIKNNHEMHLKQRKRRRKGIEPAGSIPKVEQQEPVQPDIPLPSPLSSSLPETGEQTQYEKPLTELCPPVIKAKRGRWPSLKKKQEEASSQTADDKVQEKRKPGPKKKIQMNFNVLKVVVKRPKLKRKCTKDFSPTVKGTLSDLYPLQSDGKCSFRPYVHIDSSLEPTSLCTIVNRPEEEHLLTQARKKSAADIKNLVTVTEAISNTSVMLQGPLVNKSLIDRCLTCCLCGKPSNYRELGDLCGPYYLEDGVPRKMLSLTHRSDFVQSSNTAKETEASCNIELINSQSASEKDAHQKRMNEGRSGHPRRGKRAIREQLRTRPTLCMRFKRLLLLQSRISGTAPSDGEEESRTTLQRLQMEAEAKEHWAHEACTIWTRGIILVAGKLYGLKEAAQSAAHAKCSRCQSEGASICCSWKSCTQRYHYFCAKEMGCMFQEETFSVRCPKHKAM